MNTQTANEAVPFSLDEPTIATIVELANLLAAARDAMTDEMVGRLAAAVSEGLNLLDRLTRNQGLVYLLHELDRPENQRFLVSMADAFSHAGREIAATPQAPAGILSLLEIIRGPGVVEGLRLLSLIGGKLSENLREIHRKGVGAQP